jgi:hypothetical protein
MAILGKTYTDSTNELWAALAENVSGELNSSTGRLDFLAKVQAGKMVVLNTFDSVPVGFSMVGDHAYAVTGYNTSTGRFTLQNPWGSYAEISYSDLAANYEWWDATA